MRRSHGGVGRTGNQAGPIGGEGPSVVPPGAAFKLRCPPWRIASDAMRQHEHVSETRLVQ